PDALRMIVARPLTGGGEDGTGLAFGRYISADWAPGVTYDRTHSGLLETAATRRLISVAAHGWRLLTLLRVFRLSRSSDSVAVPRGLEPRLHAPTLGRRAGWPCRVAALGRPGRDRAPALRGSRRRREEAQSPSGCTACVRARARHRPVLRPRTPAPGQRWRLT